MWRVNDLNVCHDRDRKSKEDLLFLEHYFKRSRSNLESLNEYNLMFISFTLFQVSDMFGVGIICSMLRR